jgi:hypothetical protein
MLDSYGVADRVELVEGDFFTEVPVVADIYMLKHIIHDWYDDKNQKILGNIRAIMPDDAKVLIIDVVVPEGNEPAFRQDHRSRDADGSGRCRTDSIGIQRAVGQLGFKLNRIIQTPGMMSIIEAIKA